MFELLNDKCQDNFSLTADETLRKFQGRCHLSVYMLQKPERHGLLFKVLTDANYHYDSRMLPYTGTPANAEGIAPEHQSPTSIVKTSANIYSTLDEMSPLIIIIPTWRWLKTSLQIKT